MQTPQNDSSTPLSNLNGVPAPALPNLLHSASPDCRSPQSQSDLTFRRISLQGTKTLRPLSLHEQVKLTERWCKNIERKISRQARRISRILTSGHHADKSAIPVRYVPFTSRKPLEKVQAMRGKTHISYRKVELGFRRMKRSSQESSSGGAKTMDPKREAKKKTIEVVSEWLGGI